MMRVLIALSLLAACAADMPSRRMQAATTTPKPTTTPGPTTTTTPGASFKSTATVGAKSTAGGRRLSAEERLLGSLPAVSADYMAKAYCSALKSATGYCTSTASLASDVWTLVATITVTAGGAATTQAALNALTTTSVQTSITGYLVAEEVILASDADKFMCTGQTNEVIAAQPYVAPPAAVAFGKPAFKFTFTLNALPASTTPNVVPDGAAFTTAQVAALQTATLEMFTTVGLSASYLGLDVDCKYLGVASQWGVNASLMVPTTCVNNVLATFVDIFANVAMCAAIINKKMTKAVPGFNNTISIGSLVLSSEPTGANASLGKSLVNFSAIDVNSLRLYQQQEGHFFDVDDDKEDSAEDEKPVGSVAAWMMPTLGCVALITAVAMIGFNIRRTRAKSSTRVFTLMHPEPRSESSMEDATLIENELEAALE